MNDTYPFQLPALPYAYSSLMPYIDEETVNIHYNKHFGKYINNLNDILTDYPRYQSWSIDRLIIQNRFLPLKIQKDVYNNAGGVYNHQFYFDMLTPRSDGVMSGRLLLAVNKCFGSFENFKEQMTEAALDVFGSGYAWLLYEPNGRLRIAKTHNQETDLSVFGEKLLTIDVWEHAYYLKYQNRRVEYIKNIFNILDYKKAEKIYSDYLDSV
ncbi:MAG TPA: superoxide dismutase [Oscillospiraceae bacterium]|nr:superoxide dismutase [Oscillospiraceae bacterium]